LVAAITLAFLDHCGRLCASVDLQGAAQIITFFELAALASTAYRLSPLCGSISSRGIMLSCGKI
jgi:hypothetical protein